MGPSRSLNAIQSSHRGLAVVYFAYDGRWRFGLDFSVLRLAVCVRCSWYDRVVTGRNTYPTWLVQPSHKTALKVALYRFGAALGPDA